MNKIPKIYPITDLRNNFGEIANMVRENAAPIYLTKNGHGDMVLMSFDAYEQLIARYETELKLKEAEIEAATTDVRHDAKEVIAALRRRSGGLDEI